jgi:hypothetical protein
MVTSELLPAAIEIAMANPHLRLRLCEIMPALSEIPELPFNYPNGNSRLTRRINSYFGLGNGEFPSDEDVDTEEDEQEIYLEAAACSDFERSARSERCYRSNRERHERTIREEQRVYPEDPTAGHVRGSHSPEDMDDDDDDSACISMCADPDEANDHEPCDTRPLGF